jgi:hypothetical protein
MEPEPSGEDPVSKPRQAMPQPVLHAREGLIATGITRKRSAAVALVAITIGAGVTAYAAIAGGQNCRRDPNDPNQTTTCSHHTNSWFGGVGRSFYDSPSVGTHTPGASTSTVTRGGFGSTAFAHASTGG